MGWKNDDSSETYNTNSQIKFKTSILRSPLCIDSDSDILVSGTITSTEAGADDAVKRLHKRNTGVIFENCAPFTDCISEIINTKIDNAKYIDDVMPMYNLIEYNHNYLKILGSLSQYYRDDPNDKVMQSQ